MRKILTIHSCQHLEKTGDNEKLLIKISIENDIGKIEKSDNNSRLQVIIINISRSVIHEWAMKNPKYEDFSNFTNGMLHYALDKIKERLKRGSKIFNNEEFLIDSYTEYNPHDTNVHRITIPYSEVIEYKGKLGFI